MGGAAANRDAGLGTRTRGPSEVGSTRPNRCSSAPVPAPSSAPVKGGAALSGEKSSRHAIFCRGEGGGGCIVWGESLRAGVLAGKLTGWQAGRQAGRQARRQAGRQAGRRAGRQAGVLAGVLAGALAGRQAGRQASRQAGRRAGRQAGSVCCRGPGCSSTCFLLASAVLSRILCRCLNRAFSLSAIACCFCS